MGIFKSGRELRLELWTVTHHRLKLKADEPTYDEKFKQMVIVLGSHHIGINLLGIILENGDLLTIKTEHFTWWYFVLFN